MQINLVENPALLGPSGILLLALLFPHEMTLTERAQFLYHFLIHCLQEPGGAPAVCNSHVEVGGRDRPSLLPFHTTCRLVVHEERRSGQVQSQK